MPSPFSSNDSIYTTLATNQLNSASADYDLLNGTNGSGFRHSSMADAYSWQNNHTVSI